MAESIWNDERNVMFVERILPAARERLVTVRDNALLIEAAKLLGNRHTNLVVVCDDDGAMVDQRCDPLPFGRPAAKHLVNHERANPVKHPYRRPEP